MWLARTKELVAQLRKSSDGELGPSKTHCSIRDAFAEASLKPGAGRATALATCSAAAVGAGYSKNHECGSGSALMTRGGRCSALRYRPAIFDLLTLRQPCGELRAHLASGGGLGNFLHRAEPVKEAKYIIEGVRVDGRPCDSADVLEQSWLDRRRHRLSGLDSEWASASGGTPGTFRNESRDMEMFEGGLDRVRSSASAWGKARLMSEAGRDPVDWLEALAVRGSPRRLRPPSDCMRVAALQKQFECPGEPSAACGQGRLGETATGLDPRRRCGTRCGGLTDYAKRISHAWALRDRAETQRRAS